FYRADMMSAPAQTPELGENAGVFSTKFSTITEKLKIVLKNDNYKFQENISGRLFTSDIGFTDNGEAYTRFWNKYERPPAPVYQQFIIDRRDLLVPQNIREVKGSFFTPKIWADKSKEYLAAVFGDNWQEEYYIWDCAAGTGNLLAGLTNKYNLWASDIEQGNVETMQSLIDIDENLNLLPAHVFQFDFLNDGFDKLPEELKKIIDDPEKRKKLIVYINPPYAEAGNKKTIIDQGANKAKVAASKIFDRFENMLGASMLELFAQFMLRIYADIPDSKLAMFSKTKHISSANFIKFREYFQASYKGGFVCKANTFDNVKGEFPIAFLIWDLDNSQRISSVVTDILLTDNDQKQCWKSGTKEFREVTKGEFSVDWLRKHYDKEGETLAYLRLHQNDIQNKNAVFITSRPSERDFIKHEAVSITKNNFIAAAIYCSIRQVIEATWLNDRDQYLFPNEGWEKDTDFQNDCLVNVLFNNVIQSSHGINHWLPFTETEVDAKEKFTSSFMTNYMKDKFFSDEAQAVLDAGRQLWKYYHKKIKNDKTASVNASCYDIREYFQGRNENGTMNTKSDDETYNALIKALRENQKILAKRIEPKIYKYGFLKE
ncbi:MAG: hypothetical protein LBF83_11160, partial [Spirochaetaceae bacterium]|nr:hypothetical protein [Spirochaetaceae bacterium]